MSDTETLTAHELAVTPEVDLPELTTEELATATAAVHDSAAVCGNCETALLGPHCYACGQPAKSILRNFHELIADFFSTVFALDSRIPRTFAPLLLQPGFLTNEYLAGRQVRYVSPVRLFVFLCLTAFFVAQLSSDWRGPETLDVGDIAITDDLRVRSLKTQFAAATTVAEVTHLRDEALAEFAEASDDAEAVPGMDEVFAGLERVIREQARERIAELDPTAPVPTVEPQEELFKPWKPKGAPAFAADWLEQKSTQLAENLKRIQQNPNLLKDALFESIPTALFMMLPLFALLLKLLYLFKRRLYMEHLIVALHSHAFLSLTVLLLALFADLSAWLTQPDTLFRSLFGLVTTALMVWVPIYLLLMQKRVYQQSWLVTSVKFSVLGIAYLALVLTATVLSALASIVNL